MKLVSPPPTAFTTTTAHVHRVVTSHMSTGEKALATIGYAAIAID